MSSLNNNPNTTSDEFEQSVDDLRQFVSISKKRSFDDFQMKVIIKNKINRLKSAYNSLISHMTLESDIRAKLLFESIPKLIDTCNGIHHDGFFELIWLELNALINSFAAGLIVIYSKGDIWSIQGSATLLVQIISGMPKVTHLPELEGQSIEDPEYLDRWIVTFNYLQFSAATYLGVIFSVKTVNLSDLILWSNQAFFYFSLINKYFKIFEWEKIGQVQKKQPANFFNVVSIIISSFQNLIELILILFKLFYTNWPLEMNTSGLFEPSFYGLSDIIKRIKNYSDVAVEKLNELFQKGMWSLNDDPMQNEAIRSIKETRRIYDYYLIYSESMLYAENLRSDLTKDTYQVEIISKAIALNRWYLSYLEKQVGERANLLGSPLGSQYVDILEQRLELLVIKVMLEKNISFYLNDLSNYNWIFLEADPSQYGNIFLRKLLSDLYLSTQDFSSFDYDILIPELKRLKESLRFRPRDYTALAILELILDTLHRGISIPKLEDILIFINKYGLINGGDYHLYPEFQEYIEFLLNSFHGDVSNLNNQFLDRRTFLNPFDSTSWLIPDFNRVFKNKITIPVYYLPFNRANDGIIQSGKFNFL